ncbi:uncharacterized protein L203_103349 [Cryptococcus depauperatus CBS 7841]|uniref:Uncharacterized protein n=1 Tax=Cryptococcus depauperatus CBS 7841 TaxID=1295531 RepID=A0A1E3I1S1_9TREE|nr:hypothetical protein L203_05382 [Cryptococcus depauperatus CBS 7841]
MSNSNLDTSSKQICPRREEHHMRITSGGSISSYVSFALSFLRSNNGVPLVLHTLPTRPSAEEKGKVKVKEKVRQEADQPSKANPKPKGVLSACTSTIPKLISVVEIIKREYILELRKNQKAGGKTRNNVIQQKGIWQYTESGLCKIAPHEEESKEEALIRVLGGNSKPKMRHHPYLSITLLTRPSTELEDKGISCQYILARQKSRRKKRKLERNGDDCEEGQDEQQEEDEGMEVDSILQSQSDNVQAMTPLSQIIKRRKSPGEDRNGKKRRTEAV